MKPARDHLFLLTPLFPDAKLGPGRYHCPECAQVEGLLSYFPYPVSYTHLRAHET